MATTERREFLISRVWLQAAVLVFLFGFFVLGLLAHRTYQAGPPVPARVVDPSGSVLFTGDDISNDQRVFLHNGLMDDISNGQRVFLRNGLMEYGSVFGHGAYLGRTFASRNGSSFR